MNAVSRMRRSKIVNYAAIDNGGLSDDDDFEDFTPPPKKKKETKIKVNLSNKENEDKSNLNDDSVRKPPAKRLSIEEKKFQKELEMALQLSQKEEKPILNEEKPILKEEVKKMSDHVSSFHGFNQDDVILTEAQSSLSIGDIDGKINEVSVESDIIEISKEEVTCGKVVKDVNGEPIASTSTGLTAKRQRKKVNFVEDDDSDDWTAEKDNAIASGSDSDEDFFASNKKKNKTKKSEKPKPKPVKTTRENNKAPKVKVSPSVMKLNECSVTLSSIEKCDSTEKNIENNTIKSNDKVDDSIIKSSNDKFANSTNYLTNDKDTKNRLKSSNNRKKPNDNVPDKAIISSRIKVNSDNQNQNNVLVLERTVERKSTTRPNTFKSPFRSPTIGQSSSSDTQNSPTAKIGLRLGLSRRGNIKPLHQNVSIR